ncbi:MAG: AraC family transcriptional regulator [Treponema sp.]|nr:AraC family transcriptional regulator [Treponema sp.]
MAIKVGAIGYNFDHDKHFLMDKPFGPGAYLLLLIKTDAKFTIKNKQFKVKKNSYILFNPATPCSYKAEKDLYIDDWFFFNMTEDDKSYLLQLGIVFDEPIELNSLENLTNIIHNIVFEHYSSDSYHEILEENYVNILFHQLARTISNKSQPAPNVLDSKNDKLTYLRSVLFEYPESFKNIEHIANYVNLSVSGLQHGYKKIFGHSVIQDIIAGRIGKAKKLLETTNYTLAEIGEKCGYKTEYHFMRQFKEQTQMTPTEYRNQSSWVQVEKSRG